MAPMGHAWTTGVQVITGLGFIMHSANLDVCVDCTSAPLA